MGELVRKNKAVTGNKLQGKPITVTDSKSGFGTRKVVFLDDNIAVIEAENANFDLSWSAQLMFTGENGEKTDVERAVSKTGKMWTALWQIVGAMVAANVGMGFIFDLESAVFSGFFVVLLLFFVLFPGYYWKENETFSKLDDSDVFKIHNNAVNGKQLTNLLAKSPNPHAITALMRSKFFAVREGADGHEYSEWLEIVLEILKNDPSYDPAFIPMTVDTARVILGKVKKIRQLKDSHAMVELKLENELSDYRRGIEVGHLEKDARSVMEMAAVRLESELKQLAEYS